MFFRLRNGRRSTIQRRTEADPREPTSGVAWRSSIISEDVASGLHYQINSGARGKRDTKEYPREVLDCIGIGIGDVLCQRIKGVADTGLTDKLERCAAHPAEDVDILRVALHTRGYSVYELGALSGLRPRSEVA